MDAIEFTGMIAAMTLGDECATCGKDGNAANAECDEHESYEQGGADAVDALCRLIEMAREIERAAVTA